MQKSSVLKLLELPAPCPLPLPQVRHSLLNRNTLLHSYQHFKNLRLCINNNFTVTISYLVAYLPTEPPPKPDHLLGTMEVPSTEDPKVRSVRAMGVSVRASLLTAPPFSSVCASVESTSGHFRIPGHCQRCAWHHVKDPGPQAGQRVWKENN